MTTAPRRRTAVLLSALFALAVLLPTTASAEVVLEPRTETVYFGAGCPPANPAGSCASTEYFLSRQPGTSNIGNLLTAVAYVQRAQSGSYAANEYNGDSTLRESYILQGGAPLSGQIVVGGFVSGAEFAVDSTVQITITAHEVGTPTFQRVTLASALVEKIVVTPGDRTYEFSVELPEELDGVAVDRLRASIGHDSVTVLGNGFVNGTGDSWFSLPYYREVPAS